MTKPRLISGIQPTGRLHIGNFLGALKNYVDLQNSGKYDCYFFLADLHSLTEDFSPAEKSKQVLELAADFIAAGLDPKKSVIFQQSQVPASSELAWILNTITPIGELRRMTQFKDKSQATQVPQHIKSEISEVFETDQAKAVREAFKDELANVGLFDYPVLMAADILLYDPKFVPVGDDQLQHLELTRTLARKFNSKFGKTFFEPQPLLTATPRVMSLDDASKKMSKSRPKGCLFLDDSPEEIRDKVKRAMTDSGTEIKSGSEKPAITNLLKIYAGISGKSVESLEKRFLGKTYSEFKNALAEEIISQFANFRKRKLELMKKQKTLKTILNSGSAKARKIASAKLKLVQKKTGLMI